MQLIADSGSTKTDWRLIGEDGTIKQFISEGLNPFFHTKESVEKVLSSTFSEIGYKNVKAVFFYGAGCSSQEKNQLLEEAFKGVFINATVTVEHDLLGAARAACGKNEGLAGILGTGSNCCVFDGQHIVQSFPSGGYILGDEGGGVSIGKALIKAFIELRMPKDLLELFNTRYKLTTTQILDKIYKEPFPNRFLASFSSFTFHHRNHPFIADLLYKVFQAYFEVQVKQFEESKNLKLNLVGSVAFYYQELIRTVAKDQSVSIGTILEKPISGLTLFHQELLTD